MQFDFNRRHSEFINSTGNVCSRSLCVALTRRVDSLACRHISSLARALIHNIVAAVSVDVAVGRARSPGRSRDDDA